LVVIVPEETIAIRHRLPGRLRLHLPVLKKDQLLPETLGVAMQGIPGVMGARASSRTGSLLIHYLPQEVGENELLQRVRDIIAHPNLSPPLPAGCVPPAPDFLCPAIAGAVLGGLLLKRLLKGESPLARSPRVVNSAALVSVIAGYPLLRRSLTGLHKGRGFNANFFLVGASLTLLLLRESLPGFLILVLAEGLHLAEEQAAYRAHVDLATLARGQDCILRPASLPPAEAGRVASYVEGASKFTLGLAAGTYLLRRDYRQALGMLVAGAPVATSLAETVVAAMGIRQAVAHGVLAADGRHFLALPTLDTLVWCQADIFTAGRPLIKEVYSLDPAYPQERLLTLGAAACRNTPHPLGPALWQLSQQQGLHLPRASKAQLLPGGAVSARVKESDVLLATGSSLRRLQISSRRGQARMHRYQQTGLLPIFVVLDGRPAGLLAVEEQLIADAPAVIASLRARGFSRQILVSQDNRERVALLAEKLGLVTFRAETGPEEKATLIKGLKDQGCLVAAIGQGPGDAAALAAADFSLALGAPLAAADMLVLGTDPGRVVEIFRLARQARTLSRQDFTLVRAFNAIGPGLAFLKLLTPATAMLWQDLLSFLLLMNAGRLRWPGTSRILKGTGTGRGDWRPG